MCVYIIFTYFFFYKSIFSYTNGLYIRRDIFHNLWVWSVLAMSCGTFVSAIKPMIWFVLLNVISIKLQCGRWYGCGSNRNRFQKLLCVVHLEGIWIRIQPIWTACASFKCQSGWLWQQAIENMMAHWYTPNDPIFLLKDTFGWSPIRRNSGEWRSIVSIPW